jgi:hypothetical protein
MDRNRQRKLEARAARQESLNAFAEREQELKANRYVQSELDFENGEFIQSLPQIEIKLPEVKKEISKLVEKKKVGRPRKGEEKTIAINRKTTIKGKGERKK